MDFARYVERVGHGPGIARGVVNLDAGEGIKLVPSPPAASTCPSESRVAVCPQRPIFSGAATLHVPLSGSNNSAAERTLAPSNPPAISTLPLRSKVAVCEYRAAF